MKKKWRGLLTGLLGIGMMLGSIGSVSAAPVPKDIQGHWAQKQLQAWLDKGYLGGYQDGTVKPNKAITRAEYVALVNRLFGYTDTATISFKDLKKSNWYYSEVAKAVKAGYIGGYENNTFRPNASLTRQEAAVIAAKILKLNTKASTAKFKDSSKFAAWSRGAIAAAADKKVIKGYPDGTFGPKRALTRAEAVGIISNSVAQKPAAPGVTPAPTPTPKPTTSPAPTTSPTPAPTKAPGGGTGGGSGGGGGGGGVTTPTVTNAAYGHVGSVTADVYLTPNVTGAVYYVVAPYAINVNAPSAQQVKDGQIAAGTAGVHHGTKATTAGTTVSFTVYGLKADTEYATYVTVADSYGNWSSVATVRLKTAPAGANAIVVAQPGNIGTVTADVYVKYGTAGGTAQEVRYVVLKDNAAAPTATQVAEGKDSAGTLLSSALKGTISAKPGVGHTHTLSGLTAATGYKVYLVSGHGTTWSSVEVIRIHTK
ncbi:S-layer homology domain-containing protein [Paenibacillus sonchi]|uniref:S-layer homology domain-containing protein n=1 Tax=Paenibacillus sonchi TaxID=373687 RepID=UPI001E38664F|nr:S-layer homology domain-containing protein [Paenibacillus sonchi]MCE3203654.1 S-layer homology domain-containing protein [Paenibacillus sonchi]